MARFAWAIPHLEGYVNSFLKASESGLKFKRQVSETCLLRFSSRVLLNENRRIINLDSCSLYVANMGIEIPFQNDGLGLCSLFCRGWAFSLHGGFGLFGVRFSSALAFCLEKSSGAKRALKDYADFGEEQSRNFLKFCRMRGGCSNIHFNEKIRAFVCSIWQLGGLSCCLFAILSPKNAAKTSR